MADHPKLLQLVVIFRFLKSPHSDYLVLVFWWLMRFPGIAHSDTAVQIEYIRSETIVNQWTLSWYLLLKLTTFNGQTLALITVLQLVVGLLVFRRLSVTLTRDFPKINTALRALLWSPIFGYLATSINHDFLAVCGIILLFVALYESVVKRAPLSKSLVISSGILSSFSYISIFGFVASYFCYILLFRSFRLICTLLLFVTINFSFFFFPGLTSTGLTGVSLVSDIKCAAEDPSTKFNDSQNEFIASLAPITYWTTPQIYSCASSNQVFSDISAANISGKNLLSLWVSVGLDNPGSYIKSHLMKGGFALPPPLVGKPPEVFDLESRDISKRHNVEFLLMDRTLSRHDFPLLNELRDFLDLLAFQINLLTGWLSWAGFWLLFTIIYVIRRFYLNELGLAFAQVGLIFSPLLATHLFVLLACPLPESRYLLGTILLGLTFSLTLMLEKFEKYLSIKRT